MTGRLRALALAALLVSASGCAPDVSDLASFIDSPFGAITTTVTDMDESQMGDTMTVLILRFRSYLELRDAIPFSAFSTAPESCLSEVSSSGSNFSFKADVACVFGDVVTTAAGDVIITQRDVATDPVAVTELDIEYRRVAIDALIITGFEHITETSGEDGASVRRLDLTQADIPFDYEFRLGVIDGDVPVFDYALPAPGGTVLARVTNPTTPGGFVTVVLTGLDGELRCEVRDTAWSAGELARGLCENGVTFGLPE